MKVFHIHVTPEEATELLKMHQDAFSKSGCKECNAPCCKDCAENGGYLHHQGVMGDAAQELRDQYGWNRVKGFKGETGCNLPVNLRSPTCVAFFCGERRNNFLAGGSTPGKSLTQEQHAEVVPKVKAFRRRLETIGGNGLQ